MGAQAVARLSVHPLPGNLARAVGLHGPEAAAAPAAGGAGAADMPALGGTVPLPQLLSNLLCSVDKDGAAASPYCTPALRACGNLVASDVDTTQLMVDSGCLRGLITITQCSKASLIKEAWWSISNIVADSPRLAAEVYGSRALQDALAVTLCPPLNAEAARRYGRLGQAGDCTAEVFKECAWVTANAVDELERAALREAGLREDPRDALPVGRAWARRDKAAALYPPCLRRRRAGKEAVVEEEGEEGRGGQGPYVAFALLFAGLDPAAAVLRGAAVPVRFDADIPAAAPAAAAAAAAVGAAGVGGAGARALRFPPMDPARVPLLRYCSLVRRYKAKVASLIEDGACARMVMAVIQVLVASAAPAVRSWGQRLLRRVMREHMVVVEEALDRDEEAPAAGGEGEDEEEDDDDDGGLVEAGDEPGRAVVAWRGTDWRLRRLPEPVGGMAPAGNPRGAFRFVAPQPVHTDDSDDDDVDKGDEVDDGGDSGGSDMEAEEEAEDEDDAGVNAVAKEMAAAGIDPAIF